MSSSFLYKMKWQVMRKKVLLIFCILVLGASACGNNDSQNSIDTEYYDYAEGFTGISGNKICDSPDGYYFLMNNYLMFADKNLEQKVFVCNKAECLHREEAPENKVTGNLYKQTSVCIPETSAISGKLSGKMVSLIYFSYLRSQIATSNKLYTSIIAIFVFSFSLKSQHQLQQFIKQPLYHLIFQVISSRPELLPVHQESTIIL